ncbi:hypothetical protein CIT292_09840 [Citrobacter youngae ATCC 29220]|uniref:Uncharacterized protein n=1 Tax=Citrobacter youngae ATCC 29220 TaxID=500640 RepID=D4BH33_9ENTR|nr:hypothetical protein CIT292_09840 [Citrobacter youngae ATCC 29220]
MFPAPAGINRFANNGAIASIGVPRASGDKPEHFLSRISYAMCSPRQRG